MIWSWWESYFFSPSPPKSSCSRSFSCLELYLELSQFFRRFLKIAGESIMSLRYHPRQRGKRLSSIDYKQTRKKKWIFPKHTPPYSKSKSENSNRRNTIHRYNEFRKREVFHVSKSRSKSRKKRDKLLKLRNAHGHNKINYQNFWHWCMRPFKTLSDLLRPRWPFYPGDIFRRLFRSNKLIFN
jgi:hypothetical protein